MTLHLDAQVYGSYFGFNALALAFGGGAGNLAGGSLYDLARRLAMPALPWTIFCGVGLLAALGLLLLDRVQRRTHGAIRPAAPVSGQP